MKGADDSEVAEILPENEAAAADESGQPQSADVVTTEVSLIKM